MKKRKSSSNITIQEQLSLLNLFQSMTGGEFFLPEVKAESTDSEDSFESDYKKYLDKGERIISLLKKKATKANFTKETLLDSLGNKKFADKWAFYEALKKVVRKIIHNMTNAMRNEDGWFQDFESSSFYCTFSKLYRIEVEDKGSYAHRLMEYHLTSKTKYNEYRVLKFTSKESGSEYFAPIGAELKSTYHLRSRGFTRERVYITLVDAARFLETYYLFDYFVKSRSDILKDDFLVAKWRDDLLNLLLKREKNGIISIKKELITEYLKEFLKDNGLCYYADDSREEMYANEELISTLSFLILEEETDYKKFYYWSTTLSNVYYDWWQQYSQKKEDYNFAKRLYTDYATSYMTKKNYSEKYLKAMAESKFNNFFGYVEIDADCELQKVEELELEFRALAKELCLDKGEDVSLRFRKLGNHKATGLYYPVLKCLCVDIRCPSSFAHEVGHMLDYENGELSAKYEFHELYEAYKAAVNTALDKASDSEKAVYNGKGKYNMSYYFQKTEVFARCFEMYLLRHRGVSNSLLKPELETLPYPDTEKVNDLIKTYFENNLFKMEEELYGISKQ